MRSVSTRTRSKPADALAQNWGPVRVRSTTPPERSAAFLAEADAVGARYPLIGWSTAQSDYACVWWPAPEPGPERPAPLVLPGVPVLVASATADPITPLAQKALDDWAARTTDRLGPWEERDPVGYPFGAVNNDAQRESIRRIVAFGAEHGIAVFFVLMPRYYDSPTKQAYLDRFEREFGAPLLAPPKEVLRELNDGGYSDPNHLWEKGRLAYSEWLGGEIARRTGG